MCLQENVDLYFGKKNSKKYLVSCSIKKLGYNYNYVLIQKKDSNIWKIGLNFYKTIGTTQHSSLPSWLWWHNHKDHFARNILRLHQSPPRALTAYAFWYRSVYRDHFCILPCSTSIQNPSNARSRNDEWSDYEELPPCKSKAWWDKDHWSQTA